MKLTITRSQRGTLLDAIGNAITLHQTDTENDRECGDMDSARSHRQIIKRYQRLYDRIATS